MQSEEDAQRVLAFCNNSLPDGSQSALKRFAKGFERKGCVETLGERLEELLRNALWDGDDKDKKNGLASLDMARKIMGRRARIGPALVDEDATMLTRIIKGRSLAERGMVLGQKSELYFRPLSAKFAELAAEFAIEHPAHFDPVVSELFGKYEPGFHKSPALLKPALNLLWGRLPILGDIKACRVIELLGTNNHFALLLSDGAWLDFLRRATVPVQGVICKELGKLSKADWRRAMPRCMDDRDSWGGQEEVNVGALGELLKHDLGPETQLALCEALHSLIDEDFVKLMVAPVLDKLAGKSREVACSRLLPHYGRLDTAVRRIVDCVLCGLDEEEEEAELSS